MFGFPRGGWGGDLPRRTASGQHGSLPHTAGKRKRTGTQARREKKKFWATAPTVNRSGPARPEQNWKAKMAAGPADAVLRGTHAAHVLLAEFDIEEGSKVSFQYPTPTGTEAKCGIRTRRRPPHRAPSRSASSQRPRRADVAGRRPQPRPGLDRFLSQPDGARAHCGRCRHRPGADGAAPGASVRRGGGVWAHRDGSPHYQALPAAADVSVYACCGGERGPNEALLMDANGILPLCVRRSPLAPFECFVYRFTNQSQGACAAHRLVDEGPERCARAEWVLQGDVPMQVQCGTDLIAILDTRTGDVFRRMYVAARVCG
jgi:hypothetical protein